MTAPVQGPPAFVVTLRRRPDRRRRLEADAVREGVALRFNTDLALEVDARALDLAALSGVHLFDWELAETDNKWWRRPLKMGEIACSLAHLALWRVIAGLAEPCALIFEDDAVLPPGFRSALDAVLGELSAYDPNWDLLYLGRRRWGADRELGLERLVSPGYSACLHAYALTPRGAARLIENDLEGRMMPVDEFVPASMTVHPRADVASAVRPVIRGYACREDIVTVLPKAEWGSETEATPFVGEPAERPGEGP